MYDLQVQVGLFDFSFMNLTKRTNALYLYLPFIIDSSIRMNQQSPYYEDGDGDPNGSDIRSGTTPSTNLRLPLRVSRL